MRTHMKTTIMTIIILSYSFSLQAIENAARTGFVNDGTDPVQLLQGGSQEEGFEDITTLTSWIMDNQSMPVGSSGWFQGNELVFNAQSGSNASYIAANFSNTAGTDICNWLIMPDLGYLQTLSFWSRTSIASQFPDRLMVLHSPSGGTNTGDCINDFGDFTETLIELNPTLSTGGYPESWTQFNTVVDGPGRVAFVYFVEDTDNNGNYIGIDNVQWVAGIPEADLALSSNFSPSENLQIGDAITVNHTLNNNGPGDASLVTVNINLPDGLEYVTNTCGAQSNGSNIIWEVGNLVNAGSTACNITVVMSGNGQQLYQANVTGSEDDLNPTNNNNQFFINGPIAIIPTTNLLGLLFSSNRFASKAYC